MGGAAIIETIEYRADTSRHDAFVAAFTNARSLGLAARGCRSIELTREAGSSGSITTYRARIEWRTRAEQAAFAASEGANAFDAALAAFERRGHHLGTLIPIAPIASIAPIAPIASAPRADGEAPAVDLDSAELRRAFAHYPTGVAVITAAGPNGPVAMVVSSFATVSLRPPLVAFCAAHTSTTWPTIADARSCCINVLASSQGDLCKQLASKSGNRFEGVGWSPAESGAPVLHGVVGWLECVIVEVRLAGDHDLVLLEVLRHEVEQDREPLLFHRSGYRAFASPPITT